MNNNVQLIPVDQISIVNNPRKKMDQGKFDELVESIKERGQLQPVLVQTLGKDKYRMVAGHRRLQAMKTLDESHIQAVVTQRDDEGAALDALVENLQRESMDPFDEAQAMSTIMDSFNLTQAQLATRLGVSQAYISQRMKLMDRASDVVKDAVASGTITATSAPGQARTAVAPSDREFIAM